MVELKQVIGRFRKNDGTICRVAWDQDKVFLNGRWLATINRQPGNPFWVSELLSESQIEEVMEAVAAQRGGVRPAWVKSHAEIKGATVLDDEEDTEGEDTETDLSDE